MTRSTRSRRSSRLRPTVQTMESRLLLTAAGSLDTTFGGGTGSYVSTPEGSNISSIPPATAIATESDNSILVAGVVGEMGTQQLHLSHLTASGTLDTSFGTSGTSSVYIPAGFNDSGNADSAYSSTADANATLLIQPDGKILVMVELTYAIAGNPPLDEAFVTRFNANGSVDSTFGTDGSTTVKFFEANGLQYANFKQMALQSNGDIVLAGTGSSTGQTGIDDVVVARLTPVGTLDTSFGTGGVVFFTDLSAGDLMNGSNGENVTALAILGSGQILIGATIIIEEGFASPRPNFVDTPELIRLNTDGSRDTAISQAGITSLNINVPQQLIVEPSGDILVTGVSKAGSEVLASLNGAGTLNQIVSLPSAFSSLNSTVLAALAPDGDVVLLTGSATSTGALEFVSTRITPGLQVRGSYGTNGVSETTINLPYESLNQQFGFTTGNPIALAIDNVGNIDALSANFPNTFVVTRLKDIRTAVSGDFTDDGISDVAVYLAASGSFAIRPSSGGSDEIIPFGIAGVGQTIPAPGDYTGVGYDELGVYLPSQGVYAYRPADGPDVVVPFGIAGPGQSIPVPADYFGTGQSDIAVYMPSIGAFGIRNPAGGPDEIVPFGMAGPGQSIPAPGDYFGTGQADIAVYLPSIGAFAIRNPAGGPDEIIPFGISGAGNSIPIPGDYDGSGKTELAVYLPKLGEFAYRPANGGPDVIVAFGAAGDGTLPAPGDYDGSGKTEIAVYDPNYATFAYRPANGGPDVVEAFGSAGPGQSIPLETPSGDLPQFSGIVSASSVNQSNPVVSALGLSGPTAHSSRKAIKVVNQADPSKTNGWN